MEQDDDHQQLVAATQKEAKRFEQWRSLRPLSPQEAEEVTNSPELRKRIISSIACYRDKAKGNGPLQAKTQIVAQGSLTRQSPTPNRVSEFLLLSVFIAGMNRLACESEMAWQVWVADVPAAFLQDEQGLSERAGEFFLQGPKNLIVKECSQQRQWPGLARYQIV